MPSAIVFGDEALVQRHLHLWAGANDGHGDGAVRIETVNEPGNVVVTSADDATLRLALEHLRGQGMHSLALAVIPAKQSSLTVLLQVLVAVAIAVSTYEFFKSDGWNNNEDQLTPSERWASITYSIPMSLWLVWVTVAAAGFIKLLFYTIKRTIYGGVMPPPSYQRVNPLKPIVE